METPTNVLGKTDPEYDLLPEDPSVSEAGSAANHSLRTAPAFTGEVLDILGPTVLPQRALYGRLISQHASDLPSTALVPKIYINSNTPFSAVVCGVQGSGKSHSTAVLLESCLMMDPRIGTLPEPLSALVFHFDTAAGGGLVQPSEAAYLSALNPRLASEGVLAPNVTVLVVPTYLKAMRKVYAGLPAVKVEPLLFAPGDISGERLLAMMKVDESKEMPLYMESIMMILRSMQDDFEYSAFRAALDEQKFNKSQVAMLRLRLALLDSCLQEGNETNSVTTYFRKGRLTIIDLSSPFMDGSSACGFFDMILGLFIEADVGASGKVVVLDEAHKYLSESSTGSSGRLTDSLLTVVRQQRHLATRVVISTQEPTVVPNKFLALCSIIIAHRFSSPTWLQELGKHVSAAQSSTEELFSKIISLPTGQAIMFSPNALTVKRAEPGLDNAAFGPSGGSIVPLGQGYFLVHSRLRVTRDGGHSLLAVADPNTTTRLQRVASSSGQDATIISVTVNDSSPEPASSGSIEGSASAPPYEPTAPPDGVPSEASLQDQYGRFASLVHFLLLQRARGVSSIPRDAVESHFALFDPDAFISSSFAFDYLLFEAHDMGIVKSMNVDDCMMLELVECPVDCSSNLAQGSGSRSDDASTSSSRTAVMGPESTQQVVDIGNLATAKNDYTASELSSETAIPAHPSSPNSVQGAKPLVPSTSTSTSSTVVANRDGVPQHDPVAHLVEVMLRAHEEHTTKWMQRTLLCEKLAKEYPTIYGTSRAAVDHIISNGIAQNVLTEKTKKGKLRVGLVSEEDIVQAEHSSPPNASTTISMRGGNAVYAPVIRFIQDRAGKGPTSLKLKTVWSHFRDHQPKLYGTKRKSIKALLKTMSQLGLLEYFETPSPALDTVQLVPNASYVF